MESYSMVLVVVRSFECRLPRFCHLYHYLAGHALILARNLHTYVRVAKWKVHTYKFNVTPGVVKRMRIILAAELIVSSS